MNFNPKIWIPMALFQVAFGLAVFAITRQYYLPEVTKIKAETIPSSSVALDRITGTNPPLNNLSTFNQLKGSKDPAELSRRANELFAGKQFQRAAELYAELLAFDPNNVNTYNNLGITLHYLGRSAEAIGKLNEGIAVDSTYQRIWLTLGYVNSQVGNTRQARSALETAVKMDSDNEIGQSAIKMLNDLP